MWEAAAVGKNDGRSCPGRLEQCRSAHAGAAPAADLLATISILLDLEAHRHRAASPKPIMADTLQSVQRACNLRSLDNMEGVVASQQGDLPHAFLFLSPDGVDTRWVHASPW